MSGLSLRLYHRQQPSNSSDPPDMPGNERGGTIRLPAFFRVDGRPAVRE
jgi:hypothetical protein